MNKIAPVFLGITLMLSLVASCSSLQTEIIIKNDNFPMMNVWSYKNQEIITKLAIAEGWLAIGSENQVVAIDTITGSFLWRLGYSLESSSELVFSGEYLIITDITTRKILAITKSGEVVKSFFINSEETFEVLAAYSNFIFVKRIPSWSIEVYDLNSGKIIWSSIVDRGDTRINFDDSTDTVFFTTSGYISKQSVYTGDIIWKIDQETQSGFLNSGSLYYYSNTYANENGYIISVDAKDSDPIWKTNMLNIDLRINNFALLSNFLLASTNYGLIALDKNNGEIIWTSETEEYFYGKPIYINNLIYIRGTNTDTIYAIDPNNGQYVGFLKLGAPSIYGLSLEKDEVIYQYKNLLIVPYLDTVYVFQ